MTAFVRQHCLQLWTSLVQQKKVPVRQYIRAFELGLDRLRDSACAVRKDAVTLVMHMVLNNPYFVVVGKINDGGFDETFFLKDSTRAQFEERQNDAESKLKELRVELEKLGTGSTTEKQTQSDDDEDEENDQPEDENLQETLARVKVEEQIMRIEEIVTLFKVN